MARSPQIWLVDIRGEIAGIRELTRNATGAEFAKSWAMRRAVEHALLIIAEAAKHLPAPMKETYPEVAWHKIHGLGNTLRHEYRHIDAEVLWSVVTEHLDTLDDAAAASLRGLTEEPP